MRGAIRGPVGGLLQLDVPVPGEPGQDHVEASRPVPPLTTFAPRAVSDPYVKLNTEFATALGVSLPGDLLAVLALAADGDDYRGDCTEGEFATVALHVTDRLQATIRRADWDGSERLARSLLALVDDLVDTRVLSYLAAAL